MEPLCTVGESVRWKTGRSPSKIKRISTIYDPAMPCLGIYLKEVKSLSTRGICTPLFFASLCTIAKTWKQPTCPPVKEQIRECMHTQWNSIQPLKNMPKEHCHMQ